MTMYFAVDLYAETRQGPTLVPITEAEHRMENDEILQALLAAARTPEALPTRDVIQTAFVRASGDSQGRGYPLSISELELGQLLKPASSRIEADLDEMVRIIAQLLNEGAQTERITLFVSYV